MSAAHLTTQQLSYPEHLGADDVVDRISAVLKRAPLDNQAVFFHPAMNVPNHLARLCWKAGVSPLVPLVALQRERSLLSDPGSPQDWNLACGVVGSDKPGQTNKRWNGLLNQLLIVTELHAWYMGIGPDANFGYRQGLWPTAAERWPRVSMVQILSEKHESLGMHRCLDAAEYAQLTYTPHLALTPEQRRVDTNTLDVNADIAAQRVKEFL